MKQSINRAGRKRIVIHFHPGKQYGYKLIRRLLGDAGWNDADLRRLKMIK